MTGKCLQLVPTDKLSSDPSGWSDHRGEQETREHHRHAHLGQDWRLQWRRPGPEAMVLRLRVDGRTHRLGHDPISE